MMHDTLINKTGLKYIDYFTCLKQEIVANPLFVVNMTRKRKLTCNSSEDSEFASYLKAH